MKKALSPTRKRIKVIRAARVFLWGLCLGAAGCLTLVAASFFILIESLSVYLLWTFCCPPCIVTVGALLLPVPAQTAARIADGCGLQERAITALAFEAEDTSMCRLQRLDAERKLSALPVREALPYRMEKRPFAFLLIALSLCGVLFLLPNPMDAIQRERELTRERLRAQAEIIEKAAESIDKTGLTAEEQRELRRISSELARELRTAKETREALSNIDRLQSDVDRLQRQINGRQISGAQSLTSQPALKSLAEAMQSGDGPQMDQALLELAETLSNAEQKEAVANQLELAAELTQATEFRQALESAAQALRDGNVQAAIQSLNQLLQNAQNANGLDALMQMARIGAAQAGAAQAGSSGAGGDSRSPAQGMPGINQAGFGTTQRDQGYREGFSQSMGTFGTGEIREKVGAYERIYDPTRLGGDNEASVVPGEKGEGDSQQMALGPGLGSFAGSVPYNQVILEYQDAAVQAVSRSLLPEAQQKWVIQYFDALIE